MRGVLGSKSVSEPQMSTKRHMCPAAEGREDVPLSTSSEVPIGTSSMLPLDNPSLCLTCSAA